MIKGHATFEYGTLIAWTMTCQGEDGDLVDVVQNGWVEAYFGMLDGERTWIINRNGLSHYVPEPTIVRV